MSQLREGSTPLHWTQWYIEACRPYHGSWLIPNISRPEYCWSRTSTHLWIHPAAHRTKTRPVLFWMKNCINGWLVVLHGKPWYISSLDSLPPLYRYSSPMVRFVRWGSIFWKNCPHARSRETHPVQSCDRFLCMPYRKAIWWDWGTWNDLPRCLCSGYVSYHGWLSTHFAWRIPGSDMSSSCL